MSTNSGVIFDVDGVLVDSAEPHFQSWRRLAEELGAHLDRAQFEGTFGRQNRDIIPILFGSMPEVRMQAVADRKEAIYRDLIRSNPPIMAGAFDLIFALSRAGIRLAIGSSGPRANIELVLEALAAKDRFQALVCAEDVTRGKPDPQVFLVAAMRLGLSPDRCVVIEDAPAGIQAARAAGTKAVAVLSTHQAEAFASARPDFRPHLLVERLQDLKATTLQELLA